MSAIKVLLSMKAPAGRRSHLSVFIFHRVLSQPDPMFPSEVDAIQFDIVMGWVKNWFNVLPLDEAIRRLKTSTLPARAAAVTFDDGYADNFLVALPILQRHGLTSTFFIATGFLDGGRMWNDTVIESVRATPLNTLDVSELGLGSHPIGNFEQKRVAIDAVIRQIKYLPVPQRADLAGKLAQVVQVKPPDNLMMTSGQVLAMHRAGMQIGAHTVSHPILARLNDEQARQEIQGSKHFLEQLLGERVGLFAYPNGKPGEDYTLQTVDVVRSLDFDAAVSTRWGASGVEDDLFQIRRFTPWDRTRLRFGSRMLSNFRTA
jgi:peptidoglycan/xylan/chitin deacetylase (PgdA/CDA1 family)